MELIWMNYRSTKQYDDESLYDAWRRFKRLQRQCPHHGIPEWMLIQTFYNGLTHEFRIYIDAASGGSLLTKNPTEAKELIEKMAANDNYHLGGRNTVKKGGKIDVDALTMLTSSVQALTSRFDKFQAGTSTSPQELCQLCNVQGHIAPDCPQISQNTEEMSIEQANAFYSSNPKRPYDPYSNTYNEGWKHHPNFSYKNTQAQQNPPQPNNYNPPPPGFQQRPPNTQQPMQPEPQKSSLEVTLESFITATNSVIQHQNSSIQQLQAQSKLMENQISQLANQVSQSLKIPGTFPGQTEQPQKGQMNVVFLRSGKQLEDPPTKEPSKEVVEEAGASGKEVDNSRVEDESKEAPPKPLAPYVPKVPFPQRLAQAKLEKKFSKFLDILKKLHINIPFLDAISEMPSYAKLLKDMLSNKKKLEENTTVALNAECSAILQNTLPKKLGDPGSYSIPVKLGDIEINRALCDLGASVSLMPLSICKKLQMGELKPTRISLQLADRSVKFPLGVLEDVPLRVGKFFIPCDFVVMEMDEDVNVPIILGRPFLATAGAIIDMKKGKITFEVGDEKLEYSLFNVMGAPSMGDTVCQVDVLDELQNEQLPLNQNDDALEQVLLGKEDDNGDWQSTEYTRLLNEAKANPNQNPIREKLEVMSIGESSKPPEVELKPLPSNLKYAYLGPNNSYPVIVNAELKDTELEQLLNVLKTYKSVIGMPFGLCNAPATFQRCMMAIFSRLIENSMEVFMDDFSVYGTSFDGIVLGHVVSNKGIEVEKAKIEVIERLPPPKSVKGVRSFLGHAGFYRRFIKDFSKIARPLTELLAKDVPFVFSDACLEAFNRLKEALITAPVMQPPDWSLLFEIMCDASDYAVGAVLGQRKEKKLYAIYYASKTLSSAQLNYATTEKEMLAVIYAIDKFHSYLVGSKVIIHIDHATLRYLMTKTHAKPRLIQWILQLQDYDIEIRDTKGTENVVADHLSRLLLDPEDGDDTPWFADLANFLSTGTMPHGYSSQQKKKFFSEAKRYH
ncbi:uncharacterized protein LOC110716092 [Chenopodium quinoa]|uniref:uncharacterized protein LOC110716092 n=1 Tax=Chenopodium quinoa TaxID=63459 RepID=UPI000B7909BA|nr:uncharacterized protein LOC110716092 [Chenopodium quinoa]